MGDRDSWSKEFRSSLSKKRLEQLFRYFRELFNIQLSSFETIFVVVIVVVVV